MSKFEKEYFVEEFHRGRWIPLMTISRDGVEKQKRVRITDDEAARNNSYSNEYKKRYLLSGQAEVVVSDVVTQKSAGHEAVLEIETVAVEVDPLEEAREEYKKQFGKKAHHMWKLETIQDKLK
jgi:hypothetical protein